MKKTYLEKGFTLIELLVVIAIIGILSSVVLASLSSARAKGRAAAVRSGLANIRTQIELDSSTSGYTPLATYATGVGSNGACALGIFHGANVIPIKSNVTGNMTVATDILCSVDTANATTPPSKWSIAVIMPDGTGVLCVDSSGNTKSYAGITTITTTQMTNGGCV